MVSRYKRYIKAICKTVAPVTQLTAVAVVGMTLSHFQFANDALAKKNKHAEIVVDAETGLILHQVNGSAKRHPASMTKMMTLYLVFEALEQRRWSQTTKLPVSKHAASQKGTRLKLKAGQKIRVKDAVMGLITKSANDASVVIAEALSGSERKFARLMTRKARALGMQDTYFRNASGMPDPAQITTARDMAQLARALVYHFPRYYRYFGTKKFTFKGKTYNNHNKLLESYPGLDGIKTGYINASGFNLTASAVRQGRRLIAVYFGGKTSKKRNASMKALLDRAFGSRHFASLRRNGTLAEPVAVAANHSSQNIRQASMTHSRPKPPLPPKVYNRTPRQTQYVASAQQAVPQVRQTVPRRRGVTRQSAWGIQVGAFAAFAPAHIAVTKATKHAPSLLNTTKVAIIPVNKRQSTIYRARIVGLTKKKARAACSVLERKRIPCLPVPPDDQTMLVLMNERS